MGAFAEAKSRASEQILCALSVSRPLQAAAAVQVQLGVELIVIEMTNSADTDVLLLCRQIEILADMARINVDVAGGPVSAGIHHTLEVGCQP